MFDFLSVALAFLVANLSMPVLRSIAFRLGILDVPDEARKIHKTAVPRMGGVGIYLGVAAALLLQADTVNSLIPVLIGGSVIMAVGIIEDVRRLSASFRLFCQCFGAMIVIILGGRVDFIPLGMGPWKVPLEILLSLVWIVGITNAYNYLDGLDGLAAGSVAINSFFFAFILYFTHQHTLGIFMVILIAACLGFLPYNFRKEKKMFLGDAGSTFLGFTLASIAIVGTWAENSIVKISIPFLILGVPTFDMVFTTIMRIRDKKIANFVEWLEYAGKDHFHHYLVDLGLYPLEAVLFIYCLTIALGIGAVIVTAGTLKIALLTLSEAAIIFFMIAILIVVGKKRHSGWET